MSASLVGSEMCIRDRSSSAALPASRVRLAVLRGTPRPIRSGPAANPTMAVSYTHLTLPTICSV
eukprot:7593223-Alexandrium_andersonii.AAC.1